MRDVDAMGLGDPIRIGDTKAHIEEHGKAIHLGTASALGNPPVDRDAIARLTLRPDEVKAFLVSNAGHLDRIPDLRGQEPHL